MWALGVHLIFKDYFLIGKGRVDLSSVSAHGRPHRRQKTAVGDGFGPAAVVNRGGLGCS
jgi:hypothetical protein